MLIVSQLPKTWKQSKCPSLDEWIIKMWDIHKWSTIEQYKEMGYRYIATALVNLENIIVSEGKYHMRGECLIKYTFR